MASLIDSIKSVAGDSHPFFKITGFSIIVFLVLQLNELAGVSPALKTTAIVLTILGFVGFALISVHNSINENNILIPNLFNPFYLLWIGVLGSISLLPFAALIYYGMTWIIPFFTFAPWINYVLMVIAFAILSSFFVVAMLLFCKNFNPISAYNFKYTLMYIGDFITCNFVLAFGVVLVLGVIFLPIGFAVQLMFNYGLVFNFFLIFTIIFVIMFMMQYYSQLYSEYILLGDT